MQSKMDKNRRMVFWCLCLLISGMVIYGVRENLVLTRRFSHSGEAEKKAALDRSDLEFSGTRCSPETVTVEFDYKDAQ